MIEFEDGKTGEVFVKQNKEAYFKENNSWSWLNTIQQYENIEFCINALHYYLKTNNILKDGFIGSYS